jgi:AAA family ATP:ADP antiporter
MFGRLWQAFNIRENERTLVGLLVLHSFFVGLPRILGGTAAGTLFLREYDAQSLPIVYVSAAFVTPLVGFIFNRLGNRVAFGRVLLANLALQYLSLFGFYWIFIRVDAPWPAMAFAIWFQVVWVLTSLEFWGLAGRLFDVRQAKRLFVLIGSGEVVAMIVVGVLGKALIDLVSVEGLILVGSAGIPGSIVLVMFMRVRHADRMERSSTPQGNEIHPETLTSARARTRRYVASIALVAAVAYTTYFFIDNAFITQVERRFLEDSTQVANFLIIFFAVSGVCRLFTRLFLSERVINRFGVGGGLILLPAMLMIGTGGVITANFAGAALATIFLLATLTKLFDQMFRYSTDRSALLVLYQPLPARQEIRAQTFIESVIEPVTGGLTGVVLLVLVNRPGFDAVQLYYAVLGILVVWIGATIVATRGYRQMVLAALRGRTSVHTLSFEDSASVRIIEERLQSPHVGEVLYALNVLDTLDHETINDVLVRLLDHPNRIVKQDALQRIARRGLRQALGPVTTLAHHDPDVPVRAAAIRTLAGLAEDKAFDELSKYLQDTGPQIRHSAMIGLLHSGGLEGVVASARYLLKMIDSPDADVRVQAAYILGEVGIHNFYRPLLKLLEDEEPPVRHAAIIAAGKLRNPDLWSLVIPGLESSFTRGVAIFALSNADSSVIADFDAAFDDPRTPPRILIELARIAGRIQEDAMITFLRTRVLFPDLDVRLQVLSALSAQGFRARDKYEQDRVDQAIDSELETGAWIIASLAEFYNSPDTTQLADALNIELGKTRLRILYWLSFIYDPDAISDITTNLSQYGDDQHAYALEALDNLLSQEHKPWILPLFDDLTPAQQLIHLQERFPQTMPGPVDRIIGIVKRSNRWITPWLRASAIFSTGAFPDHYADFTPAVVSVLKDPAPLIAETALWALHRLAPTLYTLRAQQLDKPSRSETQEFLKTIGVLQNVVRRIDLEAREGKRMLLTIEKVMILKGVDIFSATAEEHLVDIAYQLDNMEFECGELIVKAGDSADCMYVIVTGEVRVHDQGRFIADLRDGDFFGDMALLDDQPRSASVTALRDTALLRLDRTVFQEIIHDYPEVTRGIMRVLSQRLRNSINQSAQRARQLQGESA